MRTIAIDDPGVGQSVMRAGCAETTERITILFMAETLRDPRNIALDRVPIPHGEWEGVRCGLSQITLATYLCIVYTDSNNKFKFKLWI